MRNHYLVGLTGVINIRRKRIQLVPPTFYEICSVLSKVDPYPCMESFAYTFPFRYVSTYLSDTKPSNSKAFTFSLGHLSFKSRVIQRHVMNLRRIRRWRLYDTRVDCKPRKFDIFKIAKPRYIACCSVRTADNALNMVQTKSYQVEFIRVQEEVERHAFVVQFPSGS